VKLTLYSKIPVLSCFPKKEAKKGTLAICFSLHLQLSKGRVLLRFFLLKDDVSAQLGQGNIPTHIYLSAFSANCDELPKARSLLLAGTVVEKSKKRPISMVLQSVALSSADS